MRGLFFFLLLSLFLPAGGVHAGDADGMRILAACDATHYRHSEGSAVELPDGRILLVWSRFDGHKDRCGTLGDNGPATLVLSESSDGGATWSEAQPLPVGAATRNIMQAGFVPVKKGLMLSFSVRMREGHSNVKHAIESADDGKTWTERRKLFDAGGANDRSIRLSSGRILMAAHRASSVTIGNAKDRETLVARSDDEGATWTLTEPLGHAKHEMETRQIDPQPLLIHEPALAECPDGSVLMLARSITGVLYESRSTDGGITWSVLAPTAIESFAAPPYLKRLPDGRIALLWNPIAGKGEKAAREALAKAAKMPYGPRQRLALMTSADGGKTWSDPRTLAEDGKHGFCYPWVCEKKDGAWLVFCSRTPFTIYPCDLALLPAFKP